MYDMSHLKKLKTLGQLAPAAWEGFESFDKAALADGVIPARTKELMAVAVALTTQCPYCIEIHSKKARAAGCTEAEIAETVMVAAALRAGAAITHGTHCLA
ncbi:carboxymuconolactone decarboxylase family protein [Tundrisphaera lichenicola]|uniref:carboxymuconolactone decarboxylase family protein n=1 Tax=Tundrisphaera lichenicola TaxID=2029860 RepID=UPI003EBD862D